MGWGEPQGGVVNSRNQIGRERGSFVATPGDPRPSEVSDAAVVGIARKLHGHFTVEQKETVRAVLDAGVALGYGFTFTDTVYAEVGS